MNRGNRLKEATCVWCQQKVASPFTLFWFSFSVLTRHSATVRSGCSARKGKSEESERWRHFLLTPHARCFLQPVSSVHAVWFLSISCHWFLGESLLLYPSYNLIYLFINPSTTLNLISVWRNLDNDGIWFSSSYDFTSHHFSFRYISQACSTGLA